MATVNTGAFTDVGPNARDRAHALATEYARAIQNILEGDCTAAAGAPWGDSRFRSMFCNAVQRLRRDADLWGGWRAAVRDILRG